MEMGGFLATQISRQAHLTEAVPSVYTLKRLSIKISVGVLEGSIFLSPTFQNGVSITHWCFRT